MAGNTADLTLRPRRPDDDDFLEGLSDRVFAAYSKDPQRTTRAIVTEDGAETIVAEIGRTRVGFVVVRFVELARDYGPWAKPVVARVDAIAVRPDAEGRGIGRALLAHAEAIARARTARSLSLMTAESNARARKLFEAGGFFRLARIERAYAKGQRAIAMMKPLL